MQPVPDLLERTLRGDTEAFGGVVERYQAMAFACAYSVLHNRHDAEDAVQEAFVTAYCRLRDLRDARSFPGWLRRVVLSACGRITRSPGPPTVALDAALDVASPHADPHAHLERAEVRAEVALALAALSPSCRMATTLYYIGGHSVRDVAEFLEVSPGAVKRYLFDARKRMKARLADMMRDELPEARPGDDLRRRVMDTLLERSREFEARMADYYREGPVPGESREWAAALHLRRLEDVRANAALYGIAPDEALPRMLPEYHREATFRDDFVDIPRRWGVPEGTRVVCLRDLARRLGVSPLALHRWHAEGLPVLCYTPWQAYDEATAEAWVRRHGIPAADRMTTEEGQEPVLMLLRAVAAGEAAPDEAEEVYHALSAFAWQPDPAWQPQWTARHVDERAANARLYGLAASADTWLGVPPAAPVFEVRDLCRRLGLSPFDVLRWTREGMPALRRSPYVRWDLEHVARWLADGGRLPARTVPVAELDVLERFLIGAVARGEEPPEDAREVLTGWVGVM